MANLQEWAREHATDHADLGLHHERRSSNVGAECARLEIENATLRWYLNDIRRVLDRVPDHNLPRSIRFKQWSRQTLIEMATRTAPRIAVIWGGAAAVAYMVHLVVR